MRKIRLKSCFLSVFFILAICLSTFSQADKAVERMKSRLLTATEDSNRVKILISLSYRLWQLSRYREAREYASEGLSLLEKAGFNNGKSGIYTVLGLIYDSQGDYPMSLKWHKAALDVRKEIGDTTQIAESYGNIGIVYRRLGNYPEALKYHMAELKLYEGTKRKLGLAIVHDNIGEVYRYQGNYPEALKNYLLALKLAGELGDKYGIATCKTNVGLVYNRQGNYSEALAYHRDALRLWEEIGEKSGMGNAYIHMGDDYGGKGDDAEALKNFFLALKLFEEIGHKDGIALANTSIGKTHIRQNRIPEARQYLLNGLAVSKEIGAKEAVKDIFNALSKLDSAAGNYEQALVHYKLFADYKDSLLNETTSKQLAQIREQYESEKKDREIMQLYSAKQRLEGEKQLTALLIKLKQDSLSMAHSENERVRLENEKFQAENLYKQQQIELLDYEKRLQQLQIGKDSAALAVQKAEADKRQEQLLVLGKEKDIQSLQLRKQKESKNYFIAGLVLFALLSFLVFRNFQNQRKLNRLYRVSAEKQMAELQLQSLRAQLNPHFMFNSLNAIQELIVMEENEKSQSYLERFAQLLRQLLDNANQPFIPLRKEIGFLDLYLSLEKLRLPDLQYSIDVDPRLNTESLVIPNMMLQPYIENALWHGLQHKHGEKHLQLHISGQNGTLKYRIRDNGVGRKKAEEMKTRYRKEHRSRGMALLSQRFELLSQEYGQTIQTKVTDLTEDGSAAGTVVEIMVPISLSEPDFKADFSHASG